MPYLGKTPSQGVRARYQFTPNAGTTSLSGADANGSTMTFTDGNYVDVYLNGVMLKAGVDYVTTTANTIGSLAATVASDVVDVIVYDTFSLFGGTLEGNVKVNNGTFNVTGATDLDSTLNVDGAITSSAGATISTTGQEFQLILTSTDADALQGPRLKLYRNSSSPADGDATGEFTFVGRNDNSQDVDYFQIRTDATDVSDGSEDATVHFFHMRDGTVRSSLTFAPTETIFNDDHRDLDFRVESDTVTNALFVQGSDGYVGIGTGSPSMILDVDGSSAANDVARFSGPNSGGLTFRNATSNEFIMHTATSDALIFGTGGNNERMRIDSSGNVGIGTTPLSVQSGYVNLQLGSGASVLASTGNAHVSISQNAILDTDNSWEYIADNEAANYYQDDGNHVFRVAASGSAGADITWVNAMKIDSSGNVGIGTTTMAANSRLTIAGVDNSNYLAIRNTSASDGSTYRWGYIRFEGTQSGGEVSTLARIGAFHDGTADDQKGVFTISTNGGAAGDNPTERMRIESSGHIFIVKSSSALDSVGIELLNDGRIVGTASNDRVLLINRLASDGDLVDFYQAGSKEGTISVSGSTVSYNGFSGLHETSGIASNVAIGTICSTIDELDVYPDTQKDVEGETEEHPKKGETRADHAKIKVSDTEGDKRVYGVLQRYDDNGKPLVASVGIGSVKVTGACEGGDLLESNGDGTAKVQSDDIIRSKTIGKVTIGNSGTGVKLVPCVLYCG